MDIGARIHDSIHFIGLGFVSLFTTLNPVGATAFFLSNPETFESEIYRNRIAKRASFASFVILMVFAIFGQLLFRLMGITISSFQIAGGIFVFTVALEMLRGANVRIKTLPEERVQATFKEDISIIPLGTPLLAGPGSITITILTMSKTQSLFQIACVMVNILMVCLLTYWILVRSVWLMKWIGGESGIRVINRVMGMFMAAIAVEMFLSGLKSVLAN